MTFQKIRDLFQRAKKKLTSGEEKSTFNILRNDTTRRLCLDSSGTIALIKSHPKESSHAYSLRNSSANSHPSQSSQSEDFAGIAQTIPHPAKETTEELCPNGLLLPPSHSQDHDTSSKSPRQNNTSDHLDESEAFQLPMLDITPFDCCYMHGDLVGEIVRLREENRRLKFEFEEMRTEAQQVESGLLLLFQEYHGQHTSRLRA